MQLILESEVSVDKIVQGLRGTLHDAMLIGHNVFAAAIYEKN